MLQEKSGGITELKRLRAAGLHDEAERVRRAWILEEADRAEEMGQTWTADRLRRRAAGEDIIDRMECLQCGLYFEPANQNDACCSASCREKGKLGTTGVRLTLAYPSCVP